MLIGTHPHFIEPVEIMEDKITNKIMYIFYSLGNFINSSSSKNKMFFWRFIGGKAHIIFGSINNKIVFKIHSFNYTYL